MKYVSVWLYICIEMNNSSSFYTKIAFVMVTKKIFFSIQILKMVLFHVKKKIFLFF